MTFKFGAALAVFALFSSPALAERMRPAFKAPPGGHIVVCQMREQGHSNWIAPQIVLVVDKAGKILVNDAVIEHVMGRPVEAVVMTDNTKRITYGWTVKGARDRSAQYAQALDYRLTVMKADQKARLSMLPRGYSNTVQGIGTCQRL